ncbi:MAG: CHAT domain-containing tetratricopeptide repeat protein [Chitinophagaceae bacterium]|nr:CHAT domain-containing tetratricopeptide repeat protein [Chitinophagaceae bacterium]
MNRKPILILLVIAGSIVSLFAQINKSDRFKESYREANRLYNLDDPTPETDSIALQVFLKVSNSASGRNYRIAIESLIKAGNIHQGYQRFSEANALYHQALAINSRYAKNEVLTYEAFLYLGSSLYFSNVIDSAQYYFEAASRIALSYSGKETLPERDRLYNSLGAIYYESANYKQAKNYFESALQFSPVTAEDYEEFFTGIQSNVANCLMKMNQYDSALRIFKSLRPNEQQKEIIRQNTAHSYFELGLYDSALAIYQSLSLQGGFSSVVALTDMGRIYINRKQWQQAEAVFDSAISRNRGISTAIKNKEEALAYMYRSQLAQKQGLTEEAITWINEALQEVHLNFIWKKTEDLPDDVSKTVSPITLFTILHNKAGLLHRRYKNTLQQSLLTASLAAYRKAIETANFIKQNFDNDEAKFFFNENYKSIYGEAITVAYEAARGNANYINDYLFIIENYKGNILYQNLQNVLLKSTARIPDSIRRREKEIKQLLAVYTTRINQAPAEKDAVPLQKRLLSLQVELSRLQKTYEEDASYNLYKNQQSGRQQTIKAIQATLDDKTALFNYYTGDSAIFCLVITNKNHRIQKINTDSLFYRQLFSFINEVYHYEEGKRYEGFEASFSLYKYLIEPFESETDDCSKWVVIPDGILYYLPFEAMIKKGQSKAYLMLSKTISYHYSFALLLEKSNHRSGSIIVPGNTIAFAPYTVPDSNIIKSGLPFLPLSGEEVQKATINIFSEHAATKDYFIKQTGNYPVIHLATHASAGADNSQNWIQFYPADSNSRLFLHEIYNLDLHQAELVILSACETGGGVTATGEGLLSLSRAFMYAGADGIVSTLWKTEDRVTAFLMRQMHDYLKRGLAPEEALQAAKKDLLNNNELGVQYKTPNYWANFIYVGKLHRNQSRTPLWIPWLAAFSATAIVVLYVFRKTKKTPSNI